MGEGVSVVSMVFELEGIESADQRPDSVDGAPIIFQKEAFPVSTLSHLVNVGLKTRNLHGKLVDVKQSFFRYAHSIGFQEENVPNRVFSVSAASTAPNAAKTDMLRILKRS